MCARELSMVNLMKKFQKFHDLSTYHRTIYVQISLPDVDNSSIPINRITSLSISNRTNCNTRYAIQPLFFVQLGATTSSKSRHFRMLGKYHLICQNMAIVRYLWSFNIFLLAIILCYNGAKSYHAVVVIHGVLTGSDSMDLISNRIEEVSCTKKII